MEEMPTCPDTPITYNELISEIKEIDKRENIISCLSALSVAIHHASTKIKNKNNRYYILILDYTKKVLNVYPFKSNDVESATKSYNQIESNIVAKNDDKDVVLVSANSFDSLKAAYPNYFVDISEFVSMMRRILA